MTFTISNRRSSVNRVNQLLAALALAALANQGCNTGASPKFTATTTPRQLSLEFQSGPGGGDS